MPFGQDDVLVTPTKPKQPAFVRPPTDQPATTAPAGFKNSTASTFKRDAADQAVKPGATGFDPIGYVGRVVGGEVKTSWDKLKQDFQASHPDFTKQQPKGFWNNLKADFDQHVAAGKSIVDAFQLAMSPVTGSVRAFGAKPFGYLASRVPGVKQPGQTQRQAEQAAENAFMQSIMALGTGRGGGMVFAERAAPGMPRYVEPGAEAGPIIENQPGAQPAREPATASIEGQGARSVAPAGTRPPTEPSGAATATPENAQDAFRETVRRQSRRLLEHRLGQIDEETHGPSFQRIVSQGRPEQPVPPGRALVPQGAQAASAGAGGPPMRPPGGPPPRPPAPISPGNMGAGFWRQVAAEAPQQQKTLLGYAKNAARTVQQIFSPTTVGPSSRYAEGLIREEIGKSNRMAQVAQAQLEQYRPLIAKHMPEFEGYIAAMRGTPQVAPPRPPVLLDFLNYVEGRSAGAKLRDPELQPLADQLKTVYDRYKKLAESTPSTARMGFVQDYFAHLWRDGGRAERLFSTRGGKMGSGLHTRRREMPTISDGMAAGLDPVSLDPVEMTLAYASNMGRFLANNRVVDTARAAGYIKYYSPGNQPEGWRPLAGRLAQKIVPVKVKPGSDLRSGRVLQAYAPEDFALVYNNFVSRGWHQNWVTGKIYDTLQHALNSITMLELGLSFFHAETMSMAAIASNVARNIGRAGRGEVVDGISRGARQITPLSAVSDAALTGRKFQEQFLGIADHGPDFRRIADLGARANIRVVGREATYRTSAMGSFWKAWKHGTLGSELKAAGRHVAQRPVVGSALEAARLIGRTMDTVASPIFDKLIPNLKGATFYKDMQEWLQAHPAATDQEQVLAARQIWDSVDNRFGEMVQDNIFWHKTLKQTLQLILRAPMWTIGLFRELGGGAIDLGRGVAREGIGHVKDLSPRTKYLLALPITYAIYNAMMTYLHTGQGPQDWRDLFAYNTGGKLPDGQPERALIPGHTSELLGYFHHPLTEALYKVNTLFRMSLYDIPFNRDYRGLPIYESSEWARAHGAPSWLEAMAKYILQAYTPISIKQFTQRPKGTGLSAVERATGTRIAPAWFSDPQRAHTIEQRVLRHLDQAKEKSDKAIQRRQGQ